MSVSEDKSVVIIQSQLIYLVVFGHRSLYIKLYSDFFLYSQRQVLK